MAVQTDPAERVRINLQTDIQFSKELLAILGAEREALQQRDAGQLQTAVSAKQGCLAALERNDKDRKAIQRQFRQLEWPDLIAHLDPRDTLDLQSLWAELKALLRECKDLSEINERIVARTRHSVSKLLQLMRGQMGNTGATVYDKFGRANPYQGGGTVTTA